MSALPVAEMLKDLVLAYAPVGRCTARPAECPPRRHSSMKNDGEVARCTVPTDMLLGRTPWARLPTEVHWAAGGPMQFTVSIYRDEDGVFVAECPAIPGCVSQGATEAEAEDNIRLAIRECLAARRELGMPETVTIKQIEVAV